MKAGTWRRRKEGTFWRILATGGSLMRGGGRHATAAYGQFSSSVRVADDGAGQSGNKPGIGGKLLTSQ
jgi:hypothetical protein